MSRSLASTGVSGCVSPAPWGMTALPERPWPVPDQIVGRDRHIDSETIGVAAHRPKKMAPLDLVTLLRDEGSLNVIRSEATSARMGDKARAGDGMAGAYDRIGGRRRQSGLPPGKTFDTWDEQAAPTPSPPNWVAAGAGHLRDDAALSLVPTEGWVRACMYHHPRSRVWIYDGPTRAALVKKGSSHEGGICPTSSDSPRAPGRFARSRSSLP
jgi:hypothetical protein